MKPGCCIDHSCTTKTCMTLPEGATCGQCVHIQRCSDIFGHVALDTTCDWFPRLFVTEIIKPEVQK